MRNIGYGCDGVRVHDNSDFPTTSHSFTSNESMHHEEGSWRPLMNGRYTIWGGALYFAGGGVQVLVTEVTRMCGTRLWVMFSYAHRCHGDVFMWFYSR